VILGVVAYEPDDQIAAPARVIRVDRERGFAYLDVDWDKMDDDHAYGWVVTPIVTGAVTMLSNAASAVAMRLRIKENVRAIGFINESDPCRLAAYQAGSRHIDSRIRRRASA